MGRTLKCVLLLVAVLSSVNCQEDQNITVTDTVLFISGLTKGLLGEDLGSDLGQCLFEGTDLS